MTSKPATAHTAATDRVRPSATTSPPWGRPGPTMVGGGIFNCGTGVRMNGGHMNFDGVTIKDTPVGFDLHGGATVDVRNTRYES